MINPYNPYGMVPAALESTRRTLRDIASDILETRAQEGKLQLAGKQMEIERQGLVLEGEKQKAQGLADIAKAEMEGRVATKGLQIQEDTLAENRRRTDLTDKREGERLGIEREKTGLLRSGQALDERRVRTEEEKLQMVKDEKAYLKTPLSATQLADEVGLYPAQKKIFEQMFPNGVTREQATKARDELTKNPAMMMQFAVLGTLDHIEAVKSQLSKEGQSPDVIAGLKQQLVTLEKAGNIQIKTLQFMQEGKPKVTPKQFSEFEEAITERWAVLPKEVKAERYKDNEDTFRKEQWNAYNQFLHAGSQNFQDVLKPAPDKGAKRDDQVGMTEEQKQKAGTIAHRLTSLEQNPPAQTDVARVRKQVQKRVESGDLDGAVSLLEDVAKRGVAKVKQKPVPATEQGEMAPNPSQGLRNAYIKHAAESDKKKKEEEELEKVKQQKRFRLGG